MIDLNNERNYDSPTDSQEAIVETRENTTELDSEAVTLSDVADSIDNAVDVVSALPTIMSRDKQNIPDEFKIEFFDRLVELVPRPYRRKLVRAIMDEQAVEFFMAIKKNLPLIKMIGAFAEMNRNGQDSNDMASLLNNIL